MSWTNSFSGSSRGGFAPRRGRGRGARAPQFNKPREQVKPDIEKNPLGDLVMEIRASDLTVAPEHPAHPAEISACHYVASYSWLKDQVPTIVVPGKPPLWTPLAIPQRLQEDRGQYFRDPNAAKYPEYPMSPVVHAVLERDPDYPTDRIDLFACGSTLGNLLRFARGIDKAFRFNVEVIGNTIFFVRKENDPKELIQGVRGFGHTFPEAYTTWGDLPNSDSHQRIVRYTFGGLECLVRFESDGYIKDTSTKDDTTSDKGALTDDDLVKALQGVAVEFSSGKHDGGTNELKVKRGGSEVPQNSVFDLKTRSGKYKKEIDMGDIYPQLWVKQIPNFIIAYHDGAGLFEDIRVQDVKSEVQAWEKANSNGLRRFVALLELILQVARNNKHTLLEVYCPGSDLLEIREQYGDGMRTLPLHLSDRWADYEQREDSGHSDSPPNGGINLSDGDDGDEFRYDDHRYHFGSEYEDDSGSEPDYTACSADDCGYCGKCSY